jgi:uncharacterized surface protein with fasciclin (FAS1) repeats
VIRAFRTSARDKSRDSLFGCWPAWQSRSTVKEGTVMLDEAKVVKTDIPCKNGVIHVIDGVIRPKAKAKK